MPSGTATTSGKIIRWTSTDQSIRYFDVYRRSDNATASLTTGDIVAKVGFGTNHYIDLVDNEDRWYWLRAISWAGKSSSFTDTITAGNSIAIDGEPTGFPNRTDSTHSFTTATRTYSISPSVTSFNYYISGVKYTETAASTVVLDNSSGITAIFFSSSAGLTSIKDPTDAQVDVAIRERALTAIIYYGTADASAIYFGEERHGLVMDGVIHSYEHFTNGLQIMTGLAIATITADGDGSLDAHAQFGVAEGVANDEDISHAISSVASTSGLSIYYKTGTVPVWNKNDNAGFSVMTAAAGARLVFNDINSGNWTLTEIGNNNFTLCHVFSTTEKDKPMIAIMGEQEYTNKLAARQGAGTEISDILLATALTLEIAPIATIIYQTGNGYGNGVNAKVISTDEGDTHIDWRNTPISRGGGTGDHGSLSGLTDDDHAQYLLLAGRTAAQSVAGDTNIGTAGDTINLQGNNLTLRAEDGTANQTYAYLPINTAGDTKTKFCIWVDTATMTVKVSV